MHAIESPRDDDDLVLGGMKYFSLILRIGILTLLTTPSQGFLASLSWNLSRVEGPACLSEGFLDVRNFLFLLGEVEKEPSADPEGVADDPEPELKPEFEEKLEDTVH